MAGRQSQTIRQVEEGKLYCREKDLGSAPMTDPATLTSYIRWCAKNYPASRYELIFWDHGGGSVSGYGYDQKFPSAGSMGLAQYGDYLIASEETEPGVGWYYTDWLTAFGKDPSMPTIQVGQKIIDDFVDVCAKRCPGQLTTLSIVDLAEFSGTVPERLTAFSESASLLLKEQQYKTLSDARNGAREFARSSQIDQVDLVHLARDLGTDAGEALSEALLSAVKYNRTSSNMTNAYGISIYFPYQRISSVDQAVASYRQIGMDEAYARCIQQFASLEASGQAVSGGTGSPLGSLLSALGGGHSGSGAGGGNAGSSGNTGFLADKALDEEAMARYLEQNRFDQAALIWQTDGEDAPVVALGEEQWGLVQDLEPGDELEFLCDYYGYDGAYQDSFRLGEPLTVGDGELSISNVPLEGGPVQATYRFTDIYGQPYWTPILP